MGRCLRSYTFKIFKISFCNQSFFCICLDSLNKLIIFKNTFENISSIAWFSILSLSVHSIISKRAFVYLLCAKVVFSLSFILTHIEIPNIIWAILVKWLTLSVKMIIDKNSLSNEIWSDQDSNTIQKSIFNFSIDIIFLLYIELQNLNWTKRFFS